MHPLSATLARRLAVSCEVAAGIILAVVSAINLAQVLGRYLFASSFPWAEEVMRYVMMWLMMLGGTACIYRCEHMAIDAVRNWLPERHREWYRNFLFGIAGLFCLLLVWYGWPAALANASQFAAASRLPDDRALSRHSGGRRADARADRAVLARRLPAGRARRAGRLLKP